MKREEIESTLKLNSIFQEITPQQLSFLSNIAEERSILKGDFILNEGESGDELYLITEGEVEILKKDPLSGELHRVSVVKKGETLGEMALLDKGPRSASARALENAKLLYLPMSKFFSEPDQNNNYTQIILNLSKILSERLRKIGNITVTSLQAELDGKKMRIETGRFLFAILIFFSVWIFFIDLAKEILSWTKVTSIISFSLITSLTITLIFHIKRGQLPITFYGLTLKNWKRNSWEAVLFSVPIVGICTLGKWFLLRHYQIDAPLFSIETAKEGSPISSTFLKIAPYIYLLFAPVQEFISRGGIQSSIRAALFGYYSEAWAVLISSLIFASMHNYISTYYAIASFFAGLFWGWMYARQKSLVGPALSHIFTGWWILELLGLGAFIQG